METATAGGQSGHDALTMRPRVLGFGNAVDDAVEIVSRRFGLFVKLTCVAYVPWTVLQLVCNVTLEQAVDQANLADLNALALFMITVMLPLLAAYSLVIAPFMAATFTYAASELYHGREPGFRECLWYVFRRFHSVFSINLLYIVLMSAFPMLTVGLSVFLFASDTNPGLVFVLVFAGGLISVLASLLVGWLLFFVFQSVVIEESGVIRSLERSFKLSYPNLPPIFVAFLVFLFVRLSLGVVATVIPQLHTQVIANSIASGMILAFETIVRVVMYFSCRCRQENYDLLLLAREVQAGRPESPAPSIFAGLADRERAGA